MAEEFTAALFINGGSQAVRLPKECRFSGRMVRVRKVGRTVVLEPVDLPSWPTGYWERLRGLPPLPPDFERPQDLPSPHRDAVLEEPPDDRHS